MRRLDDQPIDPEVTAALDAIDATLAGERVDPAHAELAEIALLLAAQRPEIGSQFASELDQRVGRRFQAPSGRPRRRFRAWPAAGLAATGLASAIVAVSVLSSGGSTGGRFLAVTQATSTSSTSSVPSPASSAKGAHSPSGAALGVPVPVAPRTPGTAKSANSGPPLAPAAASASGSSQGLQPPANGRKIIQSAQLALTVAPEHIDDVAQQVFNVIGRENGIVESSTVTAALSPGGYAQFQLSVPSSSLPQTMAALSQLRYAAVASRTDTTQDINDQYNQAKRRLADARTLRTSLLKQLANATTQQQIDSLTAQIHDAEASISSDQATLASLGQQVNQSQITLTINSAPLPVSHSGSFTIGRAAHDAGRVLTVAAGVALIALAGLLPLGLLAALVWWIGAAIRRRRREQALDLA